MTTGASYGLKGVASLILFLGLGLASSFLTLLSFCCLEEGEVQGPDIRPKALGLWPLFGLGDQLLLLLQPCLPAVLLRLIPLWVILLGKSTEFVLGHLVGGVVFVPRLPPGGGSPGIHIDCRVASGCLDIDQVCLNWITFLTLFSLLYLIPSVNHMKLQTLLHVMNKVLLKTFYCIQISALIEEKSKVEGHQKVIWFRHTWSTPQS